jgi:lipoprotein signal peptidase
MVRLGLVLVGTATAFAAVDLAHKAGSGPEYFHARSPLYVVIVVALAALWAFGILLTRSLSMALGGGVLLGGAAGNLVSLAFWQGVPNPIFVAPIAFNLADVFVLAGFGLVAASTVVYAVSNPDRLTEPVRLR